MTDQYITASNLAEEFHVGKEFLSNALKGLTPVFSRPFGRGTMVVYSSEDARAAVRKALAKRDREHAAKKTAKKTAVKQAAVDTIVQQVDLTPVFAQLSTLQAAVDTLAADVKRLCADTLGRLDVIALKEELGEILTETPDDEPVVIDGAVVPRPPVEQAKLAQQKISVVILGAPPTMIPRIEHQFSDVYDFKFLESRHANSNRFAEMVNSYQYVIGMLDFMNHGISGIVRNSGYTYIPLKGGQSKLLDKLTELYVQVSEAT